MPTSRPSSTTSTAPIRFSAINRIASITAACGPIEWMSDVFASSSCRTLRMAVSFGQVLPRGYSRAGLPQVDEVQRPPLGLLVHPPEVFADQAQRDQLHAAQA